MTDYNKNTSLGVSAIYESRTKFHPQNLPKKKKISTPLNFIKILKTFFKYNFIISSDFFNF